MITQCLNKALVIDKIQNGKKLYSVCYKWQTSSTDHLAGVTPKIYRKLSGSIAYVGWRLKSANLCLQVIFC